MKARFKVVDVIYDDRKCQFYIFINPAPIKIIKLEDIKPDDRYLITAGYLRQIPQLFSQLAWELIALIRMSFLKILSEPPFLTLLSSISIVK